MIPARSNRKRGFPKARRGSDALRSARAIFRDAAPRTPKAECAKHQPAVQPFRPDTRQIAAPRSIVRRGPYPHDGRNSVTDVVYGFSTIPHAARISRGENSSGNSLTIRNSATSAFGEVDHKPAVRLVAGAAPQYPVEFPSILPARVVSKRHRRGNGPAFDPAGGLAQERLDSVVHAGPHNSFPPDSGEGGSSPESISNCRGFVFQ